MADLSVQKNILITGGTSGLGLELVKLFLNRGYLVVATGRQHVNLPGYKDKFKLYQVDFSDMKQVADITKKICEAYNFDFVVNNAGILSPPYFTLTIDGFEYTFQVNFLSHLLINEIILSSIKDFNPVKIVTVTSPVYRFANTGLTIQSGEHGYNAVKAYIFSKLCLTLLSEFLPLRYPQLNLKCFSFDPGTFSSGIYRMQKKWFRRMYRIASPFMRSPGKVAKILAEIMLNEEAGNGMIFNIRKRSGSIPVIDNQEKEAFRKACYDIIDPFLSS
jgi:NAD(P)-dependent dehydrogenase (short-subunit alcohol dehydrogenase family)